MPQELLAQVVAGTIRNDINHSPPENAARQLAKLRLVNRAFRDAAGMVPPKNLALLHRVAQAKRTANIIVAALWEWKNNQPPKSLDGLRHMDHVVVDLRIFKVPRPGYSTAEVADPVVQGFLDALLRHPGLRALEVVAAGGTVLSTTMDWLEQTPGVLRTLDVNTSPLNGRDHSLDAYASLHSPEHIGKALHRQNQLAELTLWHGYEWENPNNKRLSLSKTGLDKAIASLSNLKSLSLCNVGKEAAPLAHVLRSLPGLKILNLAGTRRNEPGLDATTFEEVISALQAANGLQCLNLDGVLPDGTSVMQLADVVAHLADLEILKLPSTGFNAAELETLARSLQGLKHLRTVDFSGHPLRLEGCAPFIKALADVPNLQHLHLSGPGREEPVDPHMLAHALGPLAERQDLQLHLNELNEGCATRLRAALPGLVSARGGSCDIETDWQSRLRWQVTASLS